MAAPSKVSRSGRWDIPGVADCAWNGLVAVCFTDIAGLSPAQRIPSLALQYHGEVMNGGHFQYFCNKADWDHDEVLSALRALNATKASEIFEQALGHVRAAKIAAPNSVEEYLEAEASSGLSELDSRWYEEAEAQINEMLQAYLEKHEAEFVEWVD